MKIEILSQSTVKLTLSCEDMKLYDLQYDKLALKTDEYRSKIGLLLRERSVFGADDERLCDKRMYLEAFPRYDGGCMLYISAIPERRSRKKTDCAPYAPGVRTVGAIICEVKSSQELAPLCRCLRRVYENGQADFTSRLFSDGRRFRLAVFPKSVCNRIVERIFAEFGEVIKDECGAARTYEFFKETIAENAVGTLSAD